nr:hypothetical protein [Fundidesulfovibrio agrisoli]
MAFSVLVFLGLGLGLTWVNIERVDMAYELKRLQTEIVAQESLISKLEVERNTMLTPERLRVLATQYGLTQARPGQIRRLGAAGEEIASPVIKAAPPAPEKPAKKKPEDCPPNKVMKKSPRSKVAGPADAGQDAKRKKST